MPGCPALLIAAPASGQGQTSILAGLVRLHVWRQRQGELQDGGEAIYRPNRLTTSSMHLYFPSYPDAGARLFLP
jgi:cobyrinic acid a,c-diamide synthase